MVKASPALTNFNAGELSPWLEGRVDIDKYRNGCRTLLNFIPTIQGPVRRRPGTYFVHEVKTSANQTFLAKFEFNATQAYVLEFGDYYVRFYTDHGIVESTPGVPYEVATPWSASDIVADNGTFRLHMVQSGDIIYICHPDYAPRKLSRLGALSWTLTELTTTGGPFADQNTTDTTVYASAATGTGITLTASAAIFESGHVGAIFQLEQKDVVSILQWEAGKSITAADLRRSDGKNYEAMNSATTGTVKPTHGEGAIYDGDAGVQWQFLDAGYGYVRITAVDPSGLTATADVVSTIPTNAVGSGNATTRWSFGAWNDIDGYPENAAFFKERLVFSRGIKLWMSVAADYENFSSRDVGDVTADMAISIEASSGELNDIEWMSPADKLVIGTAGTEAVAGEISTAEALGPANIQIQQQGAHGSKSIQALRVGAGAVFVQRSGRKLRDIKYSFEVDNYVSSDVTVLSSHVLAPGVVSMAYQQEPDSIVWCALGDGSLAGLTYNREQDVIGWHRHQLGGNGIVESLACIPSPDGTTDELWMVVRRTIEGTTKRYIEYLTPGYQDGDDQEDAFYVDCGLTYDGASATTISGLDHLNGMVVSVLADGGTHPERFVASGGQITLQDAHSVVQVGLPYTSTLETMRLEGGDPTGTSQGKTKRIDHITLRLMNTLGGSFGPDEDTLDIIEYRNAGDPMDIPPSLFTGDKRLAWPAGYETDGRLMIMQEDPLPMTIVGIFPEMQSY